MKKTIVQKCIEQWHEAVKNHVEHGGEIETTRLKMKDCGDFCGDLIEILTEKIANEYDDFIDEMKAKSADEIICRAYEITTKEDILFQCLEHDFILTDAETMALMEQENTLKFLYKYWCENFYETPHRMFLAIKHAAISQVGK